MSNKLFRAWLKSKFTPSAVRTIRTRPVGRRPGVERLEDRITPAVPVQFFYVPMPETQTNDAFDAIVSQTVDSTEVSITTITVTESNTTIWYDQWEDGYESKLGDPLQASTQVWGDGKNANGIAPGFANDPVGLKSGTVLQLRNDVSTPRDLAAQPLLFDSPDRFASDRTLAASRVQFPTLVNGTGGSVISSAVEVRDTRYYDTKYTAPVGTNTANAGSMYTFAAFFVQAYLDNTRIQIDANNDGDFADADDRDVVVNQGQTVVSGQNVVQGGRVVASQPVQTDLMTGEINGGYASRTYALFSNAQLANDYFTPVGFNTAVDGTNDEVRLFVYNPNAKSIQVRPETTAGLGTAQTVPAGGSAFFDVTTNTGTRLFSVGGEPFAAAGAHDQQGLTHDWGFSLQPVPALSQIAIVGLGIGNSNNPPSGGSGAGNFSPVFVTALGNTTLQIDHNNDGTIDQTVAVSRLQTVRLRDTTTNDNDNSGMKIFTLDGTLISVAWGEDGTAPTGSPGLDAGTTIPAVPVPEYFKFSDFAPGGDLNGDGRFNEGDTIRYSLRIRHIGTTPISNAVVTDILPTTQVTYLSNSTTINDGATTDPIPDSGTGTPFPLDGAGFTVTSISPGQTVTVQFDAKINTGLPAGYNNILNQSVLAYDIFLLPANDVIDLRGSIGDRVWYDVNGDGVQDAGEPGVVGATVTLTWFGADGAAGGGDDKAFTAVTVANGIWNLTNLPAGNYGTAVTTLPFGLASKTFGPASFSLPAGQVTRTDIDFGYRGTGSLAGSVYIDANNDGTRQGGETGIGGATVTLTGTDAAGVAINLTATTAADGSYSFPGLLAGTFTLAETQPAAFLDGKDKAGTTGGTLANDKVSAISLTDGATGTGYTFGELRPASLAGVVFRDDDNSGAQNGTEPGISGITITLTGTDDLGATVNLTKTTAADGSYSFAGLRPGTYKLAETQPAAFLDGKDAAGTAGGTLANDQVSAITLTEGTTGTGYTFGELLASSLAGVVFRDDDNSGVQNGTEPGISGVTIALTGTDDLGAAVNLSKTTAADGSYSFTGLRPGTYKVAETQPAGFLDGKDAVGTAGGTLANDQVSNIVLVSGSTGTGYTFGELSATSLSGVVFRDDDNSGAQNGTEPGIAGVTIALTGTDDLGNAVILSKTTAADGSYSFTGLRPGTYKINETQPAGFLDGKDTVGTAGGTLANDQVSNIILSDGAAGTGYTFGELVASGLAGVVFRDDDNSGVQNGTEPGIAGVTIALTGTDDLGNAVNLSKTTAADGSYSFTGLRPGTYKLVETQPAGFLDGKDAAGTAGGTLANDQVSNITLASNTTATGYTFGELMASSLAGVVFRDDNNNGTQNGTEPGISGVSIALTGTDDLGAAVNLSKTTAADGSYSFAGLRPGMYKINETQPAALLDGKDAAGTAGGTLANDQVSGIALVSNTTATGYTFGELRPASLAGFVFRDDNNNGTQNGTEPWVGEVAIALTGTDDLGNAVNLSATTAADGSYSFPNLRPGTYKLAETQPAGFLDGKDAAGTTGGTLVNDQVSNITISEGAAGTGYTFGELRPATLGGFVYADANANGTFQPATDPGISGVTVTLTGTDDLGNAVILTATSQADGSYTFTNLRPSNAAGYRLTETQPTAYNQGTNAAGTVTNVQSGQTTADGATGPGVDQISGVVLASGTTGVNYLFGEQGSGLSGNLFIDANQDGAIQPGDTGKSGATITATDGTNTFTTTTDTNGNFSFGNLLPGTYTVTVTVPTGYGTSTPTSKTVTLTAGGSSGNNFGITVSSLAGTVYRDDDNSAAQNGTEPGIGGVTITLTDAAGNPVTDGYGKTINPAITGADGSYSFAGIVAGNYKVIETQPALYQSATNTVGKFNGGTTGSVSGDTFTVPVPAGKNGTAYTFGERFLPGSVSGTVYQDTNNDGLRAASGEPGISGVSVTLTGTDDLGATVNLTTTTDGTGAYTFTGLRPSSAAGYTVTETQPAGFLDGKDTRGNVTPLAGSGATDTIPTVVVTPGATAAANNFGELRPASLAGVVFRDDDNSGAQTGTEPGLAGVTITLTGTDDLGNPVSVAKVSDSSGKYSFVGLRPGTYTVTETQPAAYADGKDSAGTAGGTVGNDTVSGITLAEGTAATGYTFGERGAAVSGTVFIDANRDGAIQPGDTGKGGVTVTLTDGTNTFTTTTAADGTFSFSNLPTGTYTVTETVPGGYGTSTPTSKTITLGTGGSSGNDFGVTVSTLAGTVYRDDDNSGAQNGTEPGISGVTITLTDAAGNPVTDGYGKTINPAITGADGSYSFAGIVAGNYKVVETQPTQYGQGTNAVGKFNGSTAGTVAGDTFTVPVPAGKDGTAYTFGERGATVSGSVYQDANNSGVRDAGEPGVGGLTVQLQDGTGAVVGTAVTVADGTYTFIGLLPGTYSVTEAAKPAGLLDGSETRGNTAALAGTIGTDTIPGVTLTAGSTAAGNNFGELAPAAVGDFMWEDRNGNGRQDAGEPGLAGIVVTLTGTNDLGSVSKTTTTDANGLYTFASLRPGSYQVAVTAPAGFAFTRLNSAVATATTDSDIDPATGKSAAATLAVGQTDTSRDGGLYRPVSIGDLVWLNANGDATQQAGEPGLPGVTVELIQFGPDSVLGSGDDTVTTTTTANDGTYTFAGLAPGNFRVRLTGGVPSGAAANYDLDGANDASTLLTLASGATTTAADYGYAGAGTLAGIVWQDRDASGVQTTGEPGIPNVTVQLREAGPDGVFATADDVLFPPTVTGPNGNYSFTGLPAGTYRVDVDTATLPPNALATFDRDGGNDSTTVVVFPPNTAVTDVHFGYRGTGAIGDRVWNDRNGDGVQDKNEPGLPGVTVRLQAAGADGTLGTGDDLFYTPQTTDAAGGYLFPDLLVGDYRVVVDPATLPGGVAVTGDPQGAADGKADVTLTVAAPTTTVIDFGYRGIGGIGDRLWFDIDADGTQDAGEPGLNGATVALTWAGPDGVFGTADDVSYGTVTTASDGAYSFAGLPLGAYSVAVVGGLPAGLTTPTFDADGTATANAATATLTVGTPSLATIDFGYRGTGSVGDRVWNDLNGDGVQDPGEPGFPGLPVTLTWFGPDGQPGGGDDVAFSTTTGPDGIYTFGNLPAGAFTLAVGGLATNLTPTTATPGPLTLDVGQVRTDLDFGYKGDAAIGDLVWYDVDGSGGRNNAEPGLAGVGLTVVWFGADAAEGTADDVTYTATTAADGMWTIAGLPQGSYRASVAPGTLPTGFTARTADLDGTSTTDTSLFPLLAGQKRTDVDFGYRGTGTIGDRVFEDANGSGTQTAGEPGLAGVTVRLLDPAGNLLATTTTDATGSYTFPGVAPGQYAVGFVSPAGYTFAPAGKGTDPAADSDADPTTGKTAVVTLANGATLTTLDAGLYRLATIGGTAFEDTNGDGVQTPGDPPFGGVPVTLYDTAGNPVGTTVTAVDGTYSFLNVVPGTYTVGFGLPTGTVFTAANQGTNDSKDSDADPATGKTGTFPVVSGTPVGGVDVGLYRPATLGDQVWLDQNGDGTQQANEPGLAGVTVTAVWAGPDGKFGTPDDVTRPPVVTGAGGAYQIAGLPPGQYRVVIDPATLPAGATTASFDLDGIATPNAATLAIVSGATRTDVDFGTRGTGVLGDRVWYDANGNGTQDAGEPGLTGANVSLVWAGADGDFAIAGDNLTLTTVTAADGLYSFANLPAGAFRVTVNPTGLPAGLVPNADADGVATPNVTGVALAAGQTRTDIDFGYTALGSVSGQVFVDGNNDGVPGTGETGLGGVTVTLTGTDALGNPVTVTTTTNPDGTYTFPNLAPGTYTVTEGQPTGYGSSTPNTVPVTLTPGGTATVVFGETLGTLSGTVYSDQNVSGTFDPAGGDTGLAGVTVTLTGTTVLGTPVTLVTTSGANGSYSFPGLLAGTYTLTETQPTGVYDGLDAAGTAGGTLADPLGNNVIAAIPLAGGVVGSGYQFGEFPPAGVFGFVYDDANANGVRETGESGIAGVAVTISGTVFAGTPAARPLTAADVPGGSLTVTTDAAGRWGFATLPPGVYSVSAGQPAGFLDGREQNADPAPATGLVVGNDRFDGVPLAATVRGSLNFGEFRPGVASGTVILDRNGDGVRDANDPGIAGVTITLTGTDDLGQPVTRTTVTGADGTYSIGGLRPGNYSFTFTPPETLTVVGRRSIAGVQMAPGGSVGDLVFAVRPNPRDVPIVPGNPQVLPPDRVRIDTAEDVSKQSFLSSTPAVVPVAADMTGLLRAPQFVNAASRVGRTDGKTTPLVVATGADAGRPPEVRVFDYATGKEMAKFLAYEAGFTGGVRVAVADIDGDGVDEIITAPGVGGGPLVRVFDLTGRQINQVLAYAPDYRGGLWVAAGDTDGDGRAEIVTGADVGGGPHVRVMNGRTGADLANWFAYDSAFRGGVRVAVGDTDGDGKAEVVTAAGVGGGPDIRTFSGTGGLLRSFMAYDALYRGGMFVATGDLNGDGMAEIVTAAGPGGGPHVRAFDGKTQTEVASFFAFDPATRNGVRVSTADLNADGRDDIITGTGVGGGSEVRAFDFLTGTLLEDFFADEPSARSGVFVG